MDTLSNILISLLLLLFCVFLDWLLVYKLKIFAKNVAKPDDGQEKTTNNKAVIIDFFISILLLSVGQYIISQPGKNDFGVSQWLVRTFYLAVDDMDNILMGSGLILVGVYFLLRKVWVEKVKRHLYWNLNLKDDFKLFPARPANRTIIIASILFVILLSSLYSNAYSGILPVLWITVIFLVLFWVIKWDVANRNNTNPGIQSSDIQSVLLLSLLGLIILTYKLRDFPAELVGDEGGFWSLANAIATGKDLPPIFGQGIYSFGVLSSYFQAASIKVFGGSLWGWRFSSVITAVATIPPMYFLAREMFDRRIAVASALSLVTLPYLISFSRLGYNNIQAVFIVVWSVCFFYSGYRRKNFTYLFISGIIAGLGMYTYHAAMGGFISIFLFMVFVICTSPKNRSVYINQLVIFVIGFLLMALPYMMFGLSAGGTALREKPLESVFFNTWYGHDLFSSLPEFQNAPTYQVDSATLYFSPRLWVILLIRGFVRTILSFHMPFLVGEHFIYSPLAGPISVVFSLIGLLSLFRKRWESRSLFLTILMIVNIAFFSALNTFPPRHTHLVGMIPIFSLLSGLGIFTLVDQIKAFLPRMSRLIMTIISIIFVGSVVVSGLFNFFVVVPQRYKPDFEQIISWYSMYVQNAGIVNVHLDSEKPDIRPFFLDKITTDVEYQLIPVSKFNALPAKDLINPGQLYFFTSETFQEARKVLPDIYASSYHLETFTDEGQRPVVYGIWQKNTDVRIPSTFLDIFTKSYSHPAVWILVGICIFLLIMNWLLPLFKFKYSVRISKWLAWASENHMDEDQLRLGDESAVIRKESAGLLTTLKKILSKRPSTGPLPAEIINENTLTTTLPVAIPAVALPDKVSIETGEISAKEQIESASVQNEIAEDQRPFISLEIKLRINLPSKKSTKVVRLPSKWKSPFHRIYFPVRQIYQGVLDWFVNLGNKVQGIVGHNLINWGLMLGIAVAVGMIGEYGTVISNKLIPNAWYILIGALAVAFLLSCQSVKPNFNGADDITATESFLFSSAIRQRIMVLAIVISILNITILKNHNLDKQYWDVFALWLLSIFFAISAYLPKMHVVLKGIRKINWKSLLPILVIILIGGFLRFYQLGKIPLVMENDEGTVGVRALEVLTGVRKNMFETAGGYGTLHFFFMSVPIYLFGRTVFAVRILTAIYGFLTLPVVYLLAKELFSKKIALVSTALLAVSHLHIQFSRISPTTSLDPLLSSIAFLFLYRGFKNKKTIDWVISALVMGIGLYFYVGARAMMVVSAAYICYMVVFHWGDFKKNIHNLPAYLLTFIIVSAPMFYWSYVNPEAFNARLNQVGIFQSGWVQAEMTNRNIGVIQILWEQFLSALSIFYFSFPRWFYEAEIPALHMISGFLVACGVLATILRIKNPRIALVQCWLWVTIIAGQVLQVDPTPNAYRTLGLYPAICMLGGIALVWMVEASSQKLVGKKQIIPTLIIVFVLAVEGFANIQYYYGEWAPNFLYSNKRSRMESMVGAYIGELPSGAMAYIADSESYWGEGSPSFDYRSNDHPYMDVKGSLEEVIGTISPEDKAIFILPEERYGELPTLEKELPGGEVDYQYLGKELYFIVYRVGLPLK